MCSSCEVIMTAPQKLMMVSPFFLYCSVTLSSRLRSATKADDGITILSVLQRNAVFSSAGSVRVIEKPTVVNFTDCTYHFIPHYEDQKVIENELANSPEGAIVFGHFGFDGALNNSGDADCDIGSDQFNNLTILGHIHHASERGNIRVLGTPYSTCFQDIGQKFYGILKDGEFFMEEMDTGPKHLLLEPSGALRPRCA